METPVKRGGSKAGLFLIELMIAILFFALASAVCMQLFTRAHLVARESRDLSEAVDRAQTAAEYWKAAGGSMDRLASLLDAPLGENVELLYGKDWERVTEDGAYRLIVEGEETEPGGTKAAQIRVEDLRGGGSLVFSLWTETYSPEEGMA